MQLLEQRAEAVVVEHVAVARRRPVERDAQTVRLPVLVAQRDEHRSGQLEVRTRAPSAGEAALERRDRDLMEHVGCAEGVGEHSVGDLAGHFAHALTDRGQQHRRWSAVERRGPEVRRHQRVARELALEAELAAGLPGIPDRAQREHVLAHPSGRPRPRHAVATLDVGSHLGAEAEREAAAAEALELPGRVGRLHRCAWERERDRGRDPGALGVLGGLGGGEERVAGRFGHADAGEPGLLGGRSSGADLV